MKANERKQIVTWHNANEHQEIIDFLLDKEIKNLDAEEKSLLARAYNNVEEYGKAIELLLSISDESQDDALWHFRMGYALFYKDDKNLQMAAYYFNRAYELDPDDSEAKLMMIRANKLVPMTERVPSFWAWFSNNEKRLKEIADGESKLDQETIIDFINEGTDLISKNIYFNIGGGNEFTFCVEGNPYLFYLYPYIIDQAPTELKERWRFFAQKQEIESAGFDFGMYNLRLSIPEIKVLARFDEQEEEFSIGYYLPNAESLDEDEQNHFFYTVMELVVGEGLSYNYISGIEKIAESDEMIPLSDLAPYMRTELKKLEKDCYDSPAQLYTVYQREPKDDEEDYVPRQDIFLGNTCCMPILVDYYNDETYMYCGFNSFGADTAFLSFVLPNEVDGQTALNLRNELEDSIDKFLKEKALGQLLGAGIANGVLYLDLLLFDFKEFLIQGFNSSEAVCQNIFPEKLEEKDDFKEILSQTRIFYCSFDKEAPITKIYPDDDEEEEEEEDGNAEPAYMYDEAEMECVEKHISDTFGQVDNVFHEIVSPDVHLDIMITEPTAEKNYYTLTTCGMGAYPMEVPEELKDEGINRAELCICLPPDWDIHNEDEEHYWPIRLLKILGRLPITNETWLGWGHSLGGREEGDDTLAPNVGFTGAMLVNPSGIEEGRNVCTLPNGERVNFYQLIPLYPQEVAYKCDYQAEGLLDRMHMISHIVDIKRANVCSQKDKV